MWFWIRYLLLAAILIASAAYFLVGTGPIFDFKETNNAAAQGLSRFYSSFKSNIDTSQAREKYVVELPTPELDIDQAILKQGKIVSPLTSDWRGEIQARRFEKGSTLKVALTDYAHAENVTLFWYLNKDYVVKDHFRVDSTFTSTLYQIGRAINDDYENEVYTYFCPVQRTAVITVLPSSFIREHCKQLSG